MSTFHPFSPTHAVMLLAFVAATTSLVLLRRRLGRGDPAGARRLDRSLGFFAAAVWVVTRLVPLLPSYFDVHSSLPLHVCHLALIAMPIALLTDWRPARALAYFWGVGLSSQGLFTPDLRHGPATALFWFFWLSHFVVVGGPIYDVVARGYRPAWKDFRIAAAASLVYLAVVLPFDIATGLNYGYVGPSKPGQPTLVDKLGPWPGRVAVMAGLAAVVLLLLMLPWELARLTRPTPPARPSAGPPAEAEPRPGPAAPA